MTCTILREPRRDRAFTMIEIAISVAIIAFALVAIIGVLPAGLQVQKENREDTLMAQDCTYFMEAIRGGALGLDDLVPAVSRIDIGRGDITNSYSSFANGSEVIGLLSTPGTTNVAIVRAISGALSEKGAATSDIAFRYRVRVEIIPFDPPPLATNAPPEEPSVQAQMATKLHEIRMLFQWPILANGTVGNGRQLLRSTVSGDLLWVTNNGVLYYYFRP